MCCSTFDLKQRQPVTCLTISLRPSPASFASYPKVRLSFHQVPEKNHLTNHPPNYLLPTPVTAKLSYPLPNFLAKMNYLLRLPNPAIANLRLRCLLLQDSPLSVLCHRHHFRNPCLQVSPPIPLISALPDFALFQTKSPTQVLDQ